MPREELIQKERPMRIINEIIIGFPEELVAEISPFSAHYLRPVVKVPMLLICFVCGVQTGLNMVALTFLGELFQSGTFMDAPGLIIFLAVLASANAVLMMVELNFMMARYAQLDALPIYQSMNMVLSIICGLIMLGEADRYTTGRLFGLSICMLIIVLGILILGFKKTSIAKAENED